MIGNLSCHGVLLVTDVQLQTEALMLQTPLNRHLLQLLGRIVWSRPLEHGCYGAGIDLVARFGRSGH